jgi:type I restriction enzyme S subunit
MLDTCISQHLAYVSFDKSNFDANFVLAYLSQRYSHFREISSGGGSTKGALTCAFLKSYPVPEPPVEEQQKIALWLAAVEEKIAAEKRRLDALNSIFLTLLHDLLTGKVRVHDVPALATTGGTHAPGN